jgi:hypothetical protein
MKKFKGAFRIVGLLFVLALALMGFGGVSIFSSREKYLHNRVRIEVVDKKEDERDGEVKDVQ